MLGETPYSHFTIACRETPTCSAMFFWEYWLRYRSAAKFFTIKRRLASFFIPPSDGYSAISLLYANRP